MKNLIVNLFKTLLFFDLAIIVITLIPDRKTGGEAITALWNDGMACTVLLLLTLIYHRFVEKKKFPVKRGLCNLKFLPLGILAGAVLPLLYSVAMRLFKAYSFDGFNKIPKLWMWILAIFLNALWNELLLRGYLFRLYKKHYGFFIATITTTALFISMNHELLKADRKYFAIIIMLNVLLCFLLEFSNSVIFTVFARFTYCFISGFLFGGRVFSAEYPILAKYTFEGKKALTGGEYLVEGSNVTLIILITALTLMFIIRYKLWQYLTRQKFKEYNIGIRQFFFDLKQSIAIKFARIGRVFKRKHR